MENDKLAVILTVKQFFKEIKAELKKVTWSGRKQVMSGTIAVVIIEHNHIGVPLGYRRRPVPGGQALVGARVKNMDEQLEHKWYVVHTHSNYENKAKLSLEERIKAYDCEDYFSGILVPSEQIKKSTAPGKKKTSARKYFPGYILVRMALTDKTWHVVMSTPKVTGFVGGRITPSTIPDSGGGDFKIPARRRHGVTDLTV
ncbi:MAG: preprotein translocase subunit SecE [Desulfomicrobium escambiense]|nr:preprotein translocase subunit SecE [Desulfomicrobium escambiense]